MSGGGATGSTHKCGLLELLIFVAAIVCGTACSICSKTMMQLRGVGMTGHDEQFSKPLFQTFGMFVGMCFGMVLHWAVLYFRIPFPGYEWGDEDEATAEAKNGIAMMSKVENGKAPTSAFYATEKQPLVGSTLQNSATPTTTTSNSNNNKSLPTWMYFFLAIPSLFDTLATLLCMMGLRYIDVSIYQMLRGSGIIFVALMKQHVLKDHLFNFQWAGVLGNVLSVVFVGATAILSSENSGEQANAAAKASGGEALLGVVLIMAGAFVQALQFVFEEKVMNMEIPAPPLLMIGMEGVWGTFLCVAVLYPLAYYLPGDDHGSYENFENTLAMIKSSTTIQLSFIVYFFAIFGYNLFAALVTFLLNSVWHAILDNFRPITVWSTDLFIYYVIVQTGDLGEPWTKWSFIQLTGMFVLFYGTAGKLPQPSHRLSVIVCIVFFGIRRNRAQISHEILQCHRMRSVQRTQSWLSQAGGPVVGFWVKFFEGIPGTARSGARRRLGSQADQEPSVVVVLRRTVALHFRSHAST